MKTRILTECNYKAIHLDGKTIRIALDPKKEIKELTYPEFWDVKVTSRCNGNCKYCYQSSLPEADIDYNIVIKFVQYFSQFNDNQKPFQIAFGGGEPTLHPYFVDLLQACYNRGITPNYTTNGMWVTNNATNILKATIEYCGGVAVSAHPHLEKYWREAVKLYLENGVHTNLHVIIGDTNSIDIFNKIYQEYTGKVKYFVLLPLSNQGRSTTCFNNWEYLKNSINGSPRDIAFGANFHPYLAKDHKRFPVSIYDPESMSVYLDLETMKVYKSSFSTEERKIG